MNKGVLEKIDDLEKKKNNFLQLFEQHEAKNKEPSFIGIYLTSNITLLIFKPF